MLNIYKVTLLFALTITTNAAYSTNYWQNNSKETVLSGFGECWTSANSTAITECGKKMMKVEMDSDLDGVVDSKDQCPDTAKGIKVNMKGCVGDSDGDGAADSYDRCPGTPKGINVDSTGCPLDSDGDGAADSYDKCPDTLKGINVDSTGCPMDSDNDGTADSYDRCPGTPAGDEVDSTGCTVTRDDDNDGILNANDECRGTPAGTVVDKTGCELKADIALKNVQFNTGTDVLSSASRIILNNVGRTLEANPHLKFEVAGHTDNTGNYQSNVNLSEKRAESVRQYLISRGVASHRLSAQGYGPDKPVATNNTREGRSQNRRVELILK